MFTPRQLSQTDIRFRQLLEGSPMPKSIRRVYESLAAQGHHGEGVTRQLQAKDASETERAPTLRDSHPSRKESEVTKEQAVGSSTPQNRIGEASRQKGSPLSAKAGRVERSYKRGIGKTTQTLRRRSYPASETEIQDRLRDEVANPQRRKSARASGPRDYWVLGSKTRPPIYNESDLSWGYKRRRLNTNR